MLCFGAVVKEMVVAVAVSVEAAHLEHLSLSVSRALRHATRRQETEIERVAVSARRSARAVAVQ